MRVQKNHLKLIDKLVLSAKLGIFNTFAEYFTTIMAVFKI